MTFPIVVAQTPLTCFSKSNSHDATSKCDFDAGTWSQNYVPTYPKKNQSRWQNCQSQNNFTKAFTSYPNDYQMKDVVNVSKQK